MVFSDRNSRRDISRLLNPPERSCRTSFSRLVSPAGAPPQLEPGLSALEESFERGGGQLFASATDSHWRFGLTLPNRHQGREEE